mmetsp:Transcript_17960/g.19994  ORF Transcript_17960/g.19994 Transcript_17960/m.19994 type:complete len:175 (+) Transcript_17960:46-570(+)
MPDSEDKPPARILVFLICVIITAALFICLGLLFFILFILLLADVFDGDTVDTIFACITFILLTALGIIGMYGAINRGKQWLLFYAIANFIAWLIGFIQVVLYYVAFKECQDEEKLESSLWDLFDRACDENIGDAWLWFPSLGLLLLHTFGFFGAFFSFTCLKKESKPLTENFYA